MASIVLQPLLQVIFEKLTSALVIENLSSLTSFKRDAKRLQDQLLLIQSVIRDAEERQEREGRVRLWLNRLQSISYEADDFLDELHTKAAQTNKKVSFLSVLNRILVPLLNSSELKEIQKAIADLASDISLFAFRNDVSYRRYETFERPQTGICVNESQVIGRGEDVAAIIKMLLLPSVGSSTSSPESTHVSVLPIVGMGGIGKTTVAQLVYNNNSGLENKFHTKIWIDVGQNFNVRKIIRDILEYTAKGAYNSSQLPQLGILQSRLQESIRNQKYLLVLDDVWNETEAEWSKLREPLSCGIGGSKIVVTTRSQAVAKLMGTYPSSYALKRLSDETCGDLFRQYAFPNGGEEVYPFLTGIGKDIVQKCGGIPLAAKLLGSILCSQRDEREWSKILTSRSWDFPTRSIMPALIVSYSQLGSHQKQCFSYCSVFPKNYEINREKMIHQWIAEGLIPSPADEVSRKKEDTGNDYFNDLVSASLFEVASISDEGRIAEFKVHNLIHDLAHYVSEPVREESNIEELFIWTAERRATIICSVLSAATCKRLSMERLRTLQLFSQGNNFTPYIPRLFKSTRHLRVLNLSNCGITILPKSVGGLIYLRYLDLSNNLMSILLQTLCRLFNLQTLNLSYCHDLEELPKTFSNLINLRHLNIEGCPRVIRMPPNIGNLRKLQTLPIFIVGPEYEESLFQLVHLDLRGELKIKHLENVRKNLPDFCIEYKQLHSLSLSWGDDMEGKVGHNSRREVAEMRDDRHVENLLHCLAPNRNLKVLQINEYLGTVFPEWMNRFMLPNLNKLVLVNCQRCETLPTLGQLHFLEILTMHGMGEVVEISSDFYGREGETKLFPCLKFLSLKDFPKLRSWDSVESMDAFPRLQKLSIINCPRLINMPRFPCLQRLDMHKCNDLILRSATELFTLSTLTVNDFPELLFIPKALLQNNQQLTSLTISSCPKLGMLPATLGLLTALKSLTIRWCEELENFPREMINLTSLETLEIIECPGLDSLPDESIQGLKSLKSLSIENCSNLSSLPVTLRNLTALEHLTIMYCPNLLYLPDVMQEFQALRSLNIVCCTELTYLPSELEHATSLHNLEIRGCPKLQELPDWIGNLASLRSLAISECENIKLLPEGIRRLQALQHLSIIDCPDVEMRCHKGTGEDWSKISHIPYKHVGSSASHQGEASASSSSAPVP